MGRAGRPYAAAARPLRVAGRSSAPDFKVLETLFNGR